MIKKLLLARWIAFHREARRFFISTDFWCRTNPPQKTIHKIHKNQSSNLTKRSLGVLRPNRNNSIWKNKTRQTGSYGLTKITVSKGMIYKNILKNIKKTLDISGRKVIVKSKITKTTKTKIQGETDYEACIHW